MCEDIQATHQVVVIGQRLAHAHEDDVGQRVKLGQAEDLVHDFGHGKVLLKALFARGAEKTVHLAAYLRGDTQRGAFLVGDVGRLDKMIAGREEVFLRAIAAGALVSRNAITQLPAGVYFVVADGKSFKVVVK